MAAEEPTPLPHPRRGQFCAARGAAMMSSSWRQNWCGMVLLIQVYLAENIHRDFFFTCARASGSPAEGLGIAFPATTPAAESLRALRLLRLIQTPPAITSLESARDTMAALRTTLQLRYHQNRPMSPKDAAFPDYRLRSWPIE